MTTDVDARSRVWAQWRDAVHSLGGGDTLLHFDLSAGGSIDLTSAHPGGVAQLLSGRVTRLSNIIREDRAFARALRAMALIDVNASQLSEERGIDAVNLALGLASWRHNGESFNAPVLAQAVVPRQVDGDFELLLAGRPVVNPALVAVLRRDLGISLDADFLATLAAPGSRLDPHVVLEQLTQATRGIPGFQVSHKMVLATLSNDIYATELQMRPVAHPVLDALAHVPGAADELAAQRRAVGVVSSDDRPYAQDSVLLDCGADQERILAQVAAGGSLLVHTVPGSGATRIAANVVSRLVLAGKRVAVLAASRERLRKLSATFSESGLPGLVVSPATLKRDVIAGILRNERAHNPEDPTEDEALTRIRAALSAYREALLKTSPQFGVTLGQTVNELARLALLPHPPVTTVRLNGDALRHVAAHRAEVGEQLERLADLGEFSFGPSTSSWYGARFSDTAQAKANYVVAKRLHESDFPELQRRATETFARVELRAPKTLAEMGDYIVMLLGIRDSLDRFLPDVFDRPIDELITATDPVPSPSMSSANRRRLKHLAREYVRPGMHVSDMNVALRAVSRQREWWMATATSPKPPSSPQGISDLQSQFTAVASDVRQLAAIVDQQRLGRLVDLPLNELETVLERLTRDVDALSDLQERTEIKADLKAHGLEPLVENFATLGVAGPRVRIELELAWWQSVYGYMLSDEPALLGADTRLLARLESDFARLDEHHVRTNRQRISAALGRRWSSAIQRFPAEAAVLRRRLRAGSLTAHNLVVDAPNLTTTVAPVWLCSPYTFAQQIPEGMRFDAILLLDGTALTTAEVALPVSRATQVIVFGDPAVAEPTPFTVASGTAVAPGVAATSVFEDLTPLLPRFSMWRSHRRGGRRILDFANRHFYDGHIVALPSADEVLTDRPIDFVHVERGTGIPDPVTHLVEAVPAEVTAVVDLVFAHATWHPEDSLMVVAASATHARRVRAAVRDQLKSRPHLASFFAADRPEPFVVLTVAQSAMRSRDHVIFTLGYGRTPHGRVLADFGEISGPHGKRLMAVAMTRARRALTVVSCFAPDDFDMDRLQDGARILGELYHEQAPDNLATAPQRGEPLLVDLANRLDAMGAETSINYGDQLDLIAYHGSRAVVIETDNAYARGTLREAVRLRPEMLRELGWEYRRVYTCDLFTDPQRVADEIGVQLGVKEPVMEPEEPIRRHRRATLPGKETDSGPDEAPFDETDAAWGDEPRNEDDWLLSQRPPHWGNGR